MDEVFAPRALIPPQQMKALARRSDWPGIARLASHLGLLAATGTGVWLAQISPWLAPALIAHGVVLVFLFCPLHESIHRTAFRTRRLNDTVAFLCGVTIILPAAFYRAFHFEHHRHTQDRARDPELMGAPPLTRGRYIAVLTGVPYWRLVLRTLLHHARGRVDAPFVAMRDRSTVAREARAMLTIYALAALAGVLSQSWWPVLYWFGPLLLGQPFWQAYLLSEHYGCAHEGDIFARTRTTRSNAFVRWLAWNMPFHAEHHAFPAIPFHALPAAHRLVRPHLKVTASGYLAAQRDLLA